MSVEHALVTGAGGYIGRHVVTALLDLGFSCDGRPSSGITELSSTSERRSPTQTSSTPRSKPSFIGAGAARLRVVHLAWQDGFAHNAPSHMLMLSGHFSFLSKVVEWGDTASLSARHDARSRLLGRCNRSEHRQRIPSTLYGIAKDALRKAVFNSLSDKTALSWLRCYYIFGDDRNNNSIFTRLLEAVDAGQSTFPFHHGREPVRLHQSRPTRSTNCRRRSPGRSARHHQLQHRGSYVSGRYGRGIHLGEQTPDQSGLRSISGSPVRFAGGLGRRDDHPSVDWSMIEITC